MYDHVFMDSGGSPEEIRNITFQQKFTSIPFYDLSLITPEIFLKYGPALISMKVYQEFRDPSTSIYHSSLKHQPIEQPKSQIDIPSFNGLQLKKVPPFYDHDFGGHAMIIIGVAKKGNENFFILQNWWAEKQFLLVSMQYLISCDARIEFIQGRQVSLGNKFRITNQTLIQTLDNQVSEIVYDDIYY